MEIFFRLLLYYVLYGCCAPMFFPDNYDELYWIFEGPEYDLESELEKIDHNDRPTDQMDVLFLCFKNKFNKTQHKLKVLGKQFVEDSISIENFQKNVHFAVVWDSLYGDNQTVDASSWRFKSVREFSERKTFQVHYHRDKKMHKNNVNEIIKQKVQFVQRLFSAMGGVRNEASHVAVIFLDGVNLSFEDSKSVPDIVQQQNVTDIKIFVMVLEVNHVNHIARLNDTFIIGRHKRSLSRHLLFMAIFNQCVKGWFPFKHNTTIDYLSCYKILNYKAPINWDQAEYICHTMNSTLAAIESNEELNFLQSKISTYLRDNDLVFNNNSLKFQMEKMLLKTISDYWERQRNVTEVSFQKNPRDWKSGLQTFIYDCFRDLKLDTGQFSENLFIGLRRGKRHKIRRSTWVRKPALARPLVVNHWLHGKPNGESINWCSVWEFTWNDTNSRHNSNNIDYNDGWVDVGCKDKISSLSLCEVVLPRRVEAKNIMRIKPAQTDSFEQALSKGYFINISSNIASFSEDGIHDIESVSRRAQKTLYPAFDCRLDKRNVLYIPYIFVCDSIDHCRNKRDENLCPQKLQKEYQNFVKICLGVKCSDGSCLPLRFIGDGEVDCRVNEPSSDMEEADDESKEIVKSKKGSENCALFCNNKCVHFSQLNDKHRDCSEPEEPLDERIGKLETVDACQNILNHSIWAPKCVYVKDSYNVVIGCRDMSHLQNCTDFDCPEGYVKCPNTYCIPQHYVLDGTADCPTGDDENVYTMEVCTGNFACWNSKICLHPDLVCDGHSDCPHHDDELWCDWKCAKAFRCISGTVTVSDYNTSLSELDLPRIDKSTRYINLSGVNLSSSDFVFLKSLRNLVTVIFSKCHIHSLGINFFHFTKNVQLLDLSYNQLLTLDVTILDIPLQTINQSHDNQHNNFNKYFQLQFIETLDISHTSLSFLDHSFLQRFPNLTHLNVSFTKICRINKNTFTSTPYIETLDLRGLHVTDFYEDFFSRLTFVENLYADAYQLCCLQVKGAQIPYHACHAPDDAISSCSYLIGLNIQRVLLWVVIVFAILGNMTVIGYRVVWDRSVLKTGYGLFVTNLSISDFIMGVYLFIIAGADYYYRDVYVLYDKSWRESVVCQLAGFLATLSSETSTFFVFLITLDRFLVMKFPFGQVKFSKISKIIALSLSWIVGFLLALTPIVFRFKIYSSNAMCLGLPLTTERLSGWEFSFSVFIVLNSSLFLLIVYGQRAIFRAMSENRRTQTANRRMEDITVAKQLSLIALSNFLCWFPVGLMGLLSLGRHKISNDIYAWTTVIILPINSAANPLLYTIPAVMARWEQFRFGETRTGHTSV